MSPVPQSPRPGDATSAAAPVRPDAPPPPCGAWPDPFLRTVELLVALLESREWAVAGHARRVGRLARRMAAQLGLGAEAQRDIHLGALLHDIGAVAHPERPGQPGRQGHALAGETTLMPLMDLPPVACMVRQHHEHWDGQGLPDGLAGDAICLGARLIAVASDWDRLLQGSGAERPMPPELARRHLRVGSGSRYDPAAVQALMRVLDEDSGRQVDDHRLGLRQLQPGMVLAQDLLSSRGVMLLPAGYTFEAGVIRQLTEFARREQLSLSLHVRAHPPGAPPLSLPPVT